MITDVTVIGLGAMGTALAGALLDAGRKVTVWNRSVEKSQPLVDRGAGVASDLREAIQASPRSVICLTNYSTISSQEN